MAIGEVLVVVGMSLQVACMVLVWLQRGGETA
jgi:hypothetical protein